MIVQGFQQSCAHACTCLRARPALGAVLRDGEEMVGAEKDLHARKHLLHLSLFRVYDLEGWPWLPSLGKWGRLALADAAGLIA